MSVIISIKQSGFFRLAAPLAVFVLTTLIIPRCWCGRGAASLYHGDLTAQEPYAREMMRLVDAGVDSSDFNTGSDHMDGEWAWNTYQMVAMGLCQMVIEHPEKKAEYLPVIDRCIERLKSPEMNEFVKRSYGHYGLDILGQRKDHAYLGYFNLVLGLRRMIEPNNTHAGLPARMTHPRAGRIEPYTHLLIASFPRQAKSTRFASACLMSR